MRVLILAALVGVALAACTSTGTTTRRDMDAGASRPSVSTITNR
jgi:hypothetical protein